MLISKRFLFTVAVVFIFGSFFVELSITPAYAGWEPPEKVSREECIKASQAVMAMPKIYFKAFSGICF